MARLARVRKLYRDRPRPFRALKRWAKRPKGARRKESRFRTLQKWARKRKAAVKRGLRELWEHRRKAYRRKKRFYKKRADKRAEKKAKEEASGVSTFDGKPVASEWVPILDRVRATGLWSGALNSGWRDPAYSEQLCYSICGAPSCPGRCAGRSSGHSQIKIADGASVDVSDPSGFRRGLVAIGRADLHNALGAADPWHFSVTGR